jgi:hypothetical protein
MPKCKSTTTQPPSKSNKNARGQTLFGIKERLQILQLNEGRETKEQIKPDKTLRQEAN